MQRWIRTPGQALVEFTLAATLIFFLIAAAVDLGLIFFTLQGLRTAAQEGATFGSYPEVITDGGGDVIDVRLNEAEIVNRVRHAAGDDSRGFANLLDLNNDGIDDAGQSGVLDAYITIENGRGTGLSSPCTPAQMMSAAADCHIRVTVRYDYQLVFPLSPSFANSFPISASYTLQIRSTYSG